MWYMNIFTIQIQCIGQRMIYTTHVPGQCPVRWSIISSHCFKLGWYISHTTYALGLNIRTRKHWTLMAHSPMKWKRNITEDETVFFFSLMPKMSAIYSSNAQTFRYFPVKIFFALIKDLLLKMDPSKQSPRITWHKAGLGYMLVWPLLRCSCAKHLTPTKCWRLSCVSLGEPPVAPWSQRWWISSEHFLQLQLPIFPPNLFLLWFFSHHCFVVFSSVFDSRIKTGINWMNMFKNWRGKALGLELILNAPLDNAIIMINYV